MLAIYDVPEHATTVDAETGAIEWNGDSALQDPIAREVFDTPEFTASAAGAEHETERILQKYASADGR